MIPRRSFVAGTAALAACGPLHTEPPMGMVASSQRLATRAGLDVLRAGGHAADAAVAVAAALNVTEPASTGLGGDMFALVYEAGARKVTGLNGSGRAAAALAAGRPFPPHHARAVTVPGACAGWCDLHAKYGRLPLTRALEPAIRLAEEGFPVAPWSAQGWAGGEALLRAHPGGGELLVDGRAPRAGETFRNPTLARTLRTIASGGKDAYYRGGIGRAVVDAVRKAGGDLDDGDLARHASTWTEPISTTYRGHRVWECPPNGQGLTALIALNLLEGFELRGQDPLGADRAHLLLDTLRLAFADTRWYVADPAVSKVPVAELLSKDYAAKRRALIDPRRALPRAMRGAPAAGSDTVYFCVVDAEGNACSFINSNYMGFGTGIVPEGCGFSLQNRGAGFHFEPGHPNVSAPGKRPYHTIIPGMITRADGSLYAPFGVMGGFMQPQGHVQVVVGLLDDGLSPQAAVERPRFCLQPDDAAGRAEFEEGFPAATIRDLEARGHALSGGVSGWARALFGRGQVIRRSREGALEGGSDPRADGDARSTA